MTGRHHLKIELEFIIVDVLLGDQGREVVPLGHRFIRISEMLEESFSNELLEETDKLFFVVPGQLPLHLYYNL